MPRMRTPRRNIGILILAGFTAAGFAAIPAHGGDNPTQRLYVVEQNAAQSRAERNALAQTAAALATELEGLRRDSVSAAEAMQRHEAALTMLETKLKSLGEEAAKKTAELKQDEADRGGLLMALVALARNPPEALALASPDPVVAERSALLLGNAVPPLDRAARRLADDLKQLASLRVAIGEAQAKHRSEQNLLSQQQIRLSDLIARKSELQRQAQIGSDASEEKLVALAAEAANLRDLIERLDAQRVRSAAAAAAARLAMTRKPMPVAVFPLAKTQQQDAAPVPAPQPVAATATAPPPPDPLKPPRLKSFLAAAGNYLIPASGTLVESYGKTNDVGLTSQGLAYVTRAGAQVVAPYDGRVLFAGPFKGYGEILIVEHSDGYHSLIAGLTKLDVSVGQWLIAGEPVGVMPKGEDKPRLYLELRHDGQPINPLPWLATSNEKVSG